AVLMPWPISQRPHHSVVSPFSAICSQALGANPGWSAAESKLPGKEMAMLRPPRARPERLRKSRRFMEPSSNAALISGSPHLLGRISYRGAYAYNGSAAAVIALHGGVDFVRAGVGILVQQVAGRHDLPGLAIAALRHVVL